MSPFEIKQLLIQKDQEIVNKYNNPLLGNPAAATMPVLLERSNLIIQTLVYILNELDKQQTQKKEESKIILGG
jgi:hypothetical protein